MRSTLLALALTAPALVAGCIGGSPDEPQQVTVNEGGFGQENMEVEVGTELAWRNEDDQRHTVTIVGHNLSGNESREQVVFDEPLLPGKGELYTFNETGDYVVYCKEHGSPEGGERMTVNVTGQPGGTTYDPQG